MKSKKFIDLYFEGEYSISDLDEYIKGNEIKDNEKTSEELGLTKEEYKLWKEKKNIELEEILKAKKLRIEIINKAKKFFREEIAKSHEKNTLKLKSLKAFNLNPFLDKYKANFLT